jgi:toxin-antitoxin system PIN domain toxin
VILPDINLLIYAYDSNSAFHRKAAAWWQNCLSGTELVGLPLVVLFGFVRIATHSRIFQHPMTAAEAADVVRSWLIQPCVRVLQADGELVEPALKLIEGIGSAGNLVTDAQIAALAIEHSAVVHTADPDFLRFPRLRWFNPLTGVASANLRTG